jgi:hypothetical protein
MKLTDFITLTEQVNTFGRKPYWEASLDGEFMVTHRSKEEATKLLKEELLKHVKNTQKFKIFLTKSPKYVIFVRYDRGWEYNICNLETGRNSTTIITFGTFESVCAMAEKVAESYQP